VNIEELKKIADGATKGPWDYSCCYGLATIESSTDFAIAYAVDYLEPDNATYIATFNPQRVKALLAVIEAAKEHRCYENVMSGKDRLDETIKALEEIN